MEFAFFISFFIIQRISELFLAKKNESWLREHGAREYGEKHYPFIVVLHVFFIACLIVEYIWRPETSFDSIFLLFYFLLLAGKIWTVASLGKYWNTKIFRIPGSQVVRKGPYKFVRHPNYIIVICEFIVVPLIFHLYYSMVIFSLLNGLMLRVRIREENRVWSN
ncbi:MAG: isoprenylcysteine carboxyl methyltransferase family protein [Candidatus Kapaibacterium sp.]